MKPQNRRQPQQSTPVLGLSVLWAAPLVPLLLLLVSPPVLGGVAGSRHDLSTNFEPYSDQPCVFCHTPHAANTTVAGFSAPLWNRHLDTSKVFTPYSSPTMNTVPGDPRATVSFMCLGCHDGTLGTAVVNGVFGSDKHDLVNAGGPGGIPDTTSYPNCRNCHGEMYGDPPADWQGQDLRDDRPIAMTYPTLAQDVEFNVPPDMVNGWTDLPFYAGRVECSSCHDVHDPTLVPFLRFPNTGSALCLRCHRK